jgi:hypothetical protein
MKSAMLKMRRRVESKTLRIASPRSMVVREVEREVYTRPEAATARGPGASARKFSWANAVMGEGTYRGGER